VLLTLPLIAALALGGVDRARSPWFLPRYVAVGAYAGNGVFSPTARVGWELTLIEQRTEFVFALELGPSWGIVRPAEVRVSYQHSLLAGVGLRAGRAKKLQWGLSAMAGPVLYGGRFTDPMLNEERWNGVVDGRGQLGVDLGPITLAAYVAYTQPFTVNPRFAAIGYVGGFNFGVLVNWR
jgi:hypothetical protein